VVSWPPVISQRTYPGAGDIDDCWVVATVWAAVASQPGIRQPSVTEYRRHAGDPDDGFQDGGSLTEVIAGARGSWPRLPVQPIDTTNWLEYVGPVKGGGRPSSLAVDSATLPTNVQFGFKGKHQIGVAWDAVRRTFVVANPLAPDGSRPVPITEAALKRASLALIPHMKVTRAAVFPAPLPDTGTEEDMGLRFALQAHAFGYVTIKGAGHSLIRVHDGSNVPVPDGQKREAYAKVRLLAPLDDNLGDRQTGYLVGEIWPPTQANFEAAFVLAVDVTYTPQ